MTRILVVEDEPGLRKALGINLRARGYEVALAGDGRSALTAASQHPPDAVILDLGLPDMDGVEVIEGLRGWSQAPIVVLSARSEEPDKVTALDAGADDYVTKPFGMDELLARLRAALRRARRIGGCSPPIATESFTVDLAAKQVLASDGDQIRSDADRVARSRGAGPQRGQARVTAPAAPGGLGAEIRDRDELPSRLPRPSFGGSSSPTPLIRGYLITEPGVGYRSSRD